MRVTNSMLVNNLMRNLNINLRKMDTLHNQLATGRKYAHISDDPTALIFGQAARSRLARLSHYQRTVSTAQDWIRQVEAGVMELQGRVADVYNELINAATDVKGDGDKNNVAMLIAQLRDHYVDTLNATFGDKYMYAGYNTPGDSKTGKVTGPFTLDANWNLNYNGHPLTNYLQISVGGTPINPNVARGAFGGLNIDITGDTADIPGKVNAAINNVNTLLTTGIPAAGSRPAIPGLNDLNVSIKAKYEELAQITGDITGLESTIERIDREIADLPDNYGNLAALREEREQKLLELTAKKSEQSTAQAQLGAIKQNQEEILQELDRYVNTDEAQYDAFGRVTLTIGGEPLLKVDNDPPGNIFFVGVVDDPLDPMDGIDGMVSRIEMLNKLKGDVLTFDVGPAVSIAATINGIDLAFFQASDGSTYNVFNVLHEVYLAASGGAGAEELGKLIKPLQDAQNHLLTKVAELGGRTRRLDLLQARYEQDEINYEQMKSDAEDADMAEIIMYQKMAEAVYQAALSAGARIIQPTLMDFLR